jgi:predicted flap endonuclease-1-like 5' DNA nuclease
MWYVASQYWIALILALLLGVAVGWFTCGHARRIQWRTGWLPIAAFGFLVGLIFALKHWLPNRSGLWLESALWMFALYMVGCCIGCFLKQFLHGSVPVVAVAAAAAPLKSTVSVAPVVEPAPVHKPLPVIKPEAPKPAVITPAPVVSAPVVSTPKEVMPKIEGEDLIAGKRPQGLRSALNNKADDLKRIKGIGKQNESRLHGLGIWHFDQIAAWTAAEIEWVGNYLAFPGRIDREAWLAQAADLAKGLDTEFSKRVAKGEIATSKDDGSLGSKNVADMSEDGFEGDRPIGIKAPRLGKADDLTKIKGIGKASAVKLNTLGLWHYDQIAGLSESNLLFISAFCGFPSRAIREEWAEQAKKLTKTV